MTVALADTPFRTCVVVHLGATATVAGFSNSEQPRCVVPTNYYSHGDDSHVYGLYEIADAVEQSSPRGQVYSIVSADFQKIDFPRLAEFFQFVYRAKLGVASSAYPLILTLPHDVLSGPGSGLLRTRLKSVLLEQLGVPAVHFLSEAIGTALSMGRTNALVVDCGGTRTSVSTVLDGRVTCTTASKIAGNYVDFQIMDKIRQKTAPTTTTTTTTTSGSAQQWKDSWFWLKEFKTTFLNCDPQLAPAASTPATSALSEYTSKYTSALTSPEAQANGTEDADGEEEDTEEEEKTNFLMKHSGQDVTLQFSVSELKQLSDCVFEPVGIDKEGEEYLGVSALLVHTIKKAALLASTTTTTTTSTSNSNGEETEATPIDSDTTLDEEQLQLQHAVIESLLKNVLVVGGTTLLPGFEDRVMHTLSRAYPSHKISTFANPILADRLLATYHAGVVTGNLDWELNEWEC